MIVLPVAHLYGTPVVWMAVFYKVEDHVACFKGKFLMECAKKKSQFTTILMRSKIKERDWIVSTPHTSRASPIVNLEWHANLLFCMGAAILLRGWSKNITPLPPMSHHIRKTLLMHDWNMYNKGLKLTHQVDTQFPNETTVNNSPVSTACDDFKFSRILTKAFTFS